jgi:small GTP-binding protein
VGVNFKTRHVTSDGEAITVQVWDTAGQEQFHQITTSYYKGAKGIMLVFDVCDKKSQENVDTGFAYS